MTAPYRMFSLVESCPTNQMDGVNTGAGEMGAATQYVAGWLDANRGRWFIVGEMLAVKNHFIGLDARSLTKFGYEVEVVNKKVYARRQHASGVPLSRFVTRIPPGRKDEPTQLRPDPFNWTVSELRSALSTAREWLQGSETHVSIA